MTSEVVERIKKLLRLADRNNSPEEAALAAMRAQELMAQHSLSLAEIELAGGDSATAEPIGETEIGRTGKGRNRSHWQGQLSCFVAESMNCATHWRGNHLVIIGRATAAAAVKVLHEFLVAEIERLATHGWTSIGVYSRQPSRTWRNSFHFGAVHIIGARLEETRAAQERAMKAQAATSVTTTALVIVSRDRAEVAEAVKKLNLGPPPRAVEASSRSGYLAGVEAGRTIHLGKSINGGESMSITDEAQS